MEDLPNGQGLISFRHAVAAAFHLADRHDYPRLREDSGPVTGSPPRRLSW